MPTSLVERDTQAPTGFRPKVGREPLVVAILAAYPSVRAGLASLLQLDDAVSAMSISTPLLLATDGPGNALPIATDLVLVDPGDVSRDALNALAVATRAEDVPVLWLGFPDGGLPQPGAASVIGPDIEASVLIAAIRAVATGLTVTDPALPEQMILTGGRNQDAMAIGSPLSPREQEVLQLVAAGLPNKAIARELGISDHTVKFHVSSLLTKLDAGSRTEAVTVATRRGLLFL
jgi:DNA-binding NarL/FixJ family response regulator